MPEVSRLFRKAYKTGKQDGLKALLSSTKNYIMHRTQPDYLSGRLKQQLKLECNGVAVEFDTTDDLSKRWFYPRYIDRQLHEPAFTHRLLETLNQDSVFYDIGANIGYFTIFASKKCVDGEVHSFELDTNFVDIISKNIKKNGTSAIIRQKAVSNESGNTVTYRNGTGGGVLSDTTTAQNDTKSVETTTLDEYIQSNPTPDVIKIDVEGFEYEILQGAQRLLNQSDIRTLFVEVHPEMLGDYGHNVSDIFSILEDSGFKCKIFDNHRSSDSDLIEDYNTNNINGNTMLECWN